MADRHSSSSSRRARGDNSIGQFIIGSEIGKGSFAQVYVGKHQTTGSLVAIKSVELARLNKKLKENLYSEINILKKLRHPHIVALHDCVESTTHINLIMEYCELGDLSLFIKKREKLVTHPATCDMARKYPSTPNAGLNEVVIRHFLKQLASALQFLRQGNFVHRDVKPQNLLLLPSVQYRESNREARAILSASQDSLVPATGLVSLPMLKLADFGFARVLPSTSLAETLCGSPLYMAPEILRYERYDAKADLWSVGTVLYEMVSGKPPFRASNHVELLRKIENAEDQIRFSRDVQVTSDLKALIRGLLKRNPVERMSFENFFNHIVVTQDIPGLVEDDIPKPPRPTAREIRGLSRTEEPRASPRRLSFRRQYTTDQDAGRDEISSSSPREKPLRSSPLASPAEFPSDDPAAETTSRVARSPRTEIAPGLGIRRPQPLPSTSAPTRHALHEERRRRGLSNASQNKYSPDGPSPSSSVPKDYQSKSKIRSAPLDEREETAQEAAQDIAFMRDYVVVEKRQVEVNAFADQLAAQGADAQTISPKHGQIVRRATQQGVPTSTTGAIPAERSKALQIAQGNRPDQQRWGSYDKNLAGSPKSTTSFISKAIQDASLRLLGFKYPNHLLSKGASPPQLYSPFPAYPARNAPAGLLTDGRQSAAMDEDGRVAQCIEDYATRSDVVWGFAEVKYKQLVPLTPSMDNALGGIRVDEMSEEEDGLTVEAVVSLSEEALVLYVKALSLLAKSMDIASSWWTRKSRGDPITVRDPAATQSLMFRINSIVQWVRKRFNETLEKAELMRRKLIEAQKQLPDDHQSHPNNNNSQQDSTIRTSASADGVVLTAGLSAEKLMYERALEMSRAAAINEIANEDLSGCELSYITAIRMLEAILDNDDDLPKDDTSSYFRGEHDIMREGVPEIDQDTQQAVHKVIQMITGRLTSLRKKIQMIANASKAPPPGLPRKRSGDVTSRSIPRNA